MTPALPRPRSARGRSPHDDAKVTSWALAARDGDPTAVETFVRATHKDVWRYVAHLSADPQSADDLTQDTYLRALRSLPGFEGRSSARTWLLSIARRTVADRFRFAAARPRLLDTDDWQTAAEGAQHCGLPGFEEGVALAELLALLPAQRREAFVLTSMLGLPYEEAAQVAGVPIGTVRSRVFRARTALVRLLADAERHTGAPALTGAPATVGTGAGAGAGAGRAPAPALPPFRRTAASRCTVTAFSVAGLGCGHCEKSVSAELAAIPGVTKVLVSVPAGRVTVSFERAVDDERVRRAVDGAGLTLVGRV
ncbi:sigma-70 family RNA polymerase sigma factor [Kitasatospora sp. NPDC057223]|uniref:sigma-70 family RNA polymerase sigma factor n=1 Tax=Kitasatospora sp. NPDC057223 TaxID=3346055 RepID=UPI003631C79C